MSQEKIDKRKAEKAKRKKQIAKRKQKRILNIFVSVLVTVAFIAVICLAAASLSGKFDKETTVTYSAEDLSRLQSLLGSTGNTESTDGSDETTTAADGGETTADASETTPVSEETAE